METQRVWHGKLDKSQNDNKKSERQRTYSEVSDKRGNLQPLSLVVLGETTGLFILSILNE